MALSERAHLPVDEYSYRRHSGIQDIESNTSLMRPTLPFCAVFCSERHVGLNCISENFSRQFVGSRSTSTLSLLHRCIDSKRSVTLLNEDYTRVVFGKVLQQPCHPRLITSCDCMPLP